MNLIENYSNRVNKSIGSSLKDYVKTQVKTNLDTFLEQSQYGMDVEIDGKIERIGIMTAGMTDIRDEVLVLSKPNILKMGTLFKWDDEYWVVVKREARVIKESFYGTAYRCNVDLRWIDKNGVLISQKAYAKGRGMGSILVENKYTNLPIMSRDVDTPITVITQRNLNLEQDMRFLFNGQPYRVTFIDNLSIDGTTILGMYDDIIHDGDDIINNIADFTKYNYEIKFNFEKDVTLQVGEEFEVDYEILYNGEIIDKKEIILDADQDKCKIENLVITPLEPEDIYVKAFLKDNELIKNDFIIHSGYPIINDNIFIVGPDKIEWNSSASYKLNNDNDAEFKAILPSRVKGNITVESNSITIEIGDKYSGTIKILATNGKNEYSKDVDIVTEV